MGEGTYEEHLDGSDVMLLTDEEFKAKCDRIFNRWKGIEYSTTCEPVLTEEMLNGAAQAITEGWQFDPTSAPYYWGCRVKMIRKPNKYQRRYARIGRRKKK